MYTYSDILFFQGGTNNNISIDTSIHVKRKLEFTEH